MVGALEKPRLVRPLASARESDDSSDAQDPYLLLSRRLCQAMILVGERIASQREFLERSGVSRSTAFNLMQGRTGPNTPSPATIAKLAGFCMTESYVPWSEEVTRTVAESLLPALVSQVGWREWRRKNLALVEFARHAAAADPAGEEKAVTGASLVLWLTCLGDVREGTREATASYHEACARLVKVLGNIGAGGPFVQYVQFMALHDQYVVEWNDITDWEAVLKETKDRFGVFFQLVCDYIDAGNPTLVAEHVNVLAFASRFKMVEKFEQLRTQLEEAWRRHNGANAKPPYNDRKVFRDDFDSFREWLRGATRAVHEEPTSRLQPR